MSTRYNENTFSGSLKLPGDNEASERGRYLAGIGESQIDDADKDFV